MKYLILFISLLFSSSSMASDSTHIFSLGAGYPHLQRLFYHYNSAETNFKSRGIGPVNLKYERKIKKRIGLGANINFNSFKVTFSRLYADTNGRLLDNHVEIKGYNTSLIARFNYHIINPEKSGKKEFYMGLGLGVRFGKVTQIADFDDGTIKIKIQPFLNLLPSYLHFLGFEIGMGYRYWFNKNLGMYGELGLSKSILQLGMTYRM